MKRNNGEALILPPGNKATTTSYGSVSVLGRNSFSLTWKKKKMKKKKIIRALR
jgi:hypothetical protein